MNKVNTDFANVTKFTGWWVAKHVIGLESYLVEGDTYEISRSDWSSDVCSSDLFPSHDKGVIGLEVYLVEGDAYEITHKTIGDNYGEYITTFVPTTYGK